MASKRIKGITIEIGGDTSELQKALKQVDSSLSNTQAKLKDVDKLLKLDPKNTELLKQKQELLSKSIEDTETRLKTLKDAYKQLDGKDTEEAKEQQKALAREIVDTEQKLKSFKEQMKDFGSVAKQQLQSVGKDLQNVGNKISSIGKDMTMKVSAPIIAGFTLASKTASDYEENLNKLSVAFGDYAENVQDFTDNAYLDYGLSKVDASSVASSFGAMAKGIGLADGEASEMAITLTKLSSDLASYFNTDVETAGTGLEAIFTGNAQALKKFGVVMTDVNLKEFAQSLGYTEKQYKNLGSVDKTLLRYQYVLAQTSDAQGDFARTNDGMANASKTLQASLSDLATAVGTQLLPMLVPIIIKITEFIHQISQANPELVKMAVKFGLAVAAAGPLFTIIGTLISSFGTLMTVLGAIATPVGLVVVGITAVITALALLYKKNETFRKHVDALIKNLINLIKLLFNNIKITFNQIQTYFSTVFNAIKVIVQTEINQVKIIIETVINVIKGIISVFTSVLKGDFKGAFEGLKSIVNTALDGVKQAIQNKLDGVKNIFSTIFQGAYSIVSDQIQKIKNLFNFKWELPQIKLPHFFNSGNTGPLGLPKISVEWYAKAMRNGMILNNPTIFGMNNGTLLGGGEAGSEVVVGTNSLMSMIQQAVGSATPTINMTVNGGNISANELAGVVIDRLKNEINRNNNRW